MKQQPTIIFLIPNTKLRLEAENKEDKWNTKIYQEDKKRNAITIKNGITTQELISCIKAFSNETIYKNPPKTKKAVLNFINDNRKNI